jgi:hypothetical protein
MMANAGYLWLKSGGRRKMPAFPKKCNKNNIDKEPPPQYNMCTKYTYKP